jgi:hypothetical protein
MFEFLCWAAIREAGDGRKSAGNPDSTFHLRFTLKGWNAAKPLI